MTGRSIDLALRTIAATMPLGVRERYLEEWRADASGSSSLGLSPASIVRGALAVSISINRTDPAVAGMPISALARRRGHWSLVLLIAAAPLALTSFLYGGALFVAPAIDLPLGLTIVSTLMGLVALVLLGGALIAGIGATAALVAEHGARGLLWAGGIALCAFVSLGVVVVMPFVSVIGVPLGLGLALVAGSRGAPTATRRTRGIVAAIVTIAALVIVPLQVVTTLVWEPLTKVPGHSLAEINVALAAAGEGTLADPFVIGGGIVSLALALAFSVVCLTPLGGRIPRRTLIALSLSGVWLASAIGWLGGFSIGMSIADTFMVSGGDSTAVSAVIAGWGSGCLSLALLVGASPTARPPLCAGAGARA